MKSLCRRFIFINQSELPTFAHDVPLLFNVILIDALKKKTNQKRGKKKKRETMPPFWCFFKPD